MLWVCFSSKGHEVAVEVPQHFGKNFDGFS